MTREKRIRRTGIAASLVIVAMLGLTAASVPLYDLYCRVSGYGGTPKLDGDIASVQPRAERVTVLFNADVDRALPWGFRPAQRSVNVAVGEQTLAFFEAVNRADYPVVGRAVYNVTPFKIGGYFSKIACFCFDEQTLQPGERVEMPVSFYVDPAMLDDADTHEVRQITLSYTFFIDREATKRLRAKTAARSTS